MNSYRVFSPSSENDFSLYYNLRYKVLREPWGQARGTEKDDLESTSFHAAVAYSDDIVGVGRLQMNDRETAQIRFMAVHPEHQGKGIGKILMDFLEEEAKKRNAVNIVLQARENALNFYTSCGYTISEKSFLLWNEIQHYLMVKTII